MAEDISFEIRFVEDLPDTTTAKKKRGRVDGGTVMIHKSVDIATKQGQNYTTFSPIGSPKTVIVHGLALEKSDNTNYTTAELNVFQSKEWTVPVTTDVNETLFTRMGYSQAEADAAIMLNGPFLLSQGHTQTELDNGIHSNLVILLIFGYSSSDLDDLANAGIEAPLARNKYVFDVNGLTGQALTSLRDPAIKQTSLNGNQFFAILNNLETNAPATEAEIIADAVEV